MSDRNRCNHYLEWSSYGRYKNQAISFTCWLYLWRHNVNIANVQTYKVKRNVEQFIQKKNITRPNRVCSDQGMKWVFNKYFVSFSNILPTECIAYLPYCTYGPVSRKFLKQTLSCYLCLRSALTPIRHLSGNQPTIHERHSLFYS